MRLPTTAALAAALLVLSPAPTAAQTIPLAGGTYTQNFDTLSNTAGSTTNTVLPTGWLLNETGGGARDNEQYAVDTGASNTGDTFSYGSAGSTERALGSIRSGTLIATYGACFTNQTGGTLASIDVAYTGEQWRLGTAARTDRLDAQFSLDATSLTTGTWTDVDTLDFTTPNTATTGAKDGNAAANRLAVSATISGLSIANGATFCLRWSDVDATSADDGLALDDFSLTAGSATPALSINDVTVAEGDSGTTAATFTVSLNQPAPAGGVTFDIGTADGTATAGSDYTARPTSSRTIASGASSATFAVDIAGDTQLEPNETFFVNVTNVIGANVVDGQGQGTITNDDAAASPDLSINDVSLFEGNAGTAVARFTVSLATPAPAGGVSFDVATADGTANAGSDYAAVGPVGRTIAAGASSLDVDVTINGDSTLEPDETFTLSVANVVNATVVDGSATGTIRNDDVALTAIHTVQGAGAQSPLAGTEVTIEGIVTALKGNGYFVQSPDAESDADPATSQGLFVFTSSTPPVAAAVGNRVRVFGRVTEFAFSDTTVSQLPLTQLAGASGVTLSTTLISSGNPLPTPVILQPSDLAPGNPRDAMERFEGMRVRAPSLVTVAPTNANISEANATATDGNGVFFATLAGVPRPLREPGLDPDEIVAQSAPGTIPRFDNNAEMLRVDSDGQTGAARVRADAGTTITNLVGVVDYAFAYYSLLPDPGQLANEPTSGLLGGGRSPTAVAAAGAEEIAIGGFNLLRFFDNVNDPAVGEPVLTATALDKRLGHTAEAICRYVRLPDVLGVVEVENLSVLTQLADRINAFGAAGTNGCARNPQYVAYLVEGNDVGGIDVGFLVSTREVRAGQPRVAVAEVTQFGKTATFQNPDGSNEILNDRPPLLLRAVFHHPDGGAEPVSILVNHMRSLGGVSDTAAGSNGWATSGARVRAKRGAQAQYLAQLVHDRQVADPAERIVLLGDFNVFEFNDGLVDGMGIITGLAAGPGQVLLPLASPVATPLTVMTPRSPRDEQYSFSFDGNAQSLDHAVVNQVVLDRLRDVRTEHARINADFAEARFGTGPLRVSDHDPVVLYLRPPVFRSVDLGVDAAPVSATVAAGATLGFSIDVSNASGGVADGVRLRLLLDRALPGTTASGPSGWTCSAATVGATTTEILCDAPTLAGNATVRLALAAPIGGAAAAGPITLSASVSGPNRDPASGNDADTAVVTIAANAIPVARDDGYTLPSGGLLDVAAPGVLGNDTDADGEALSASLLSPASSGTATVSSNGALRYVPSPGFTGDDAFTYRACDPRGGCATATVRLQVVAPPLVLRVREDRVVLAENTGETRLDVVANDRIDPLRRAAGRLEITRLPGMGTASLDAGTAPLDASDDRIVYRPAADRSGIDRLGYRLCEGGSGTACADGEVQIVVRPVVDGRTRLRVEGDGGFRDVTVDSYRATRDAPLAATPLVAPLIDERPLSADATPDDPWDAGGRAVLVAELAAGPAWRVLVDAASLSAGDADLHLGLDANGDGQPSRAERQCTASVGGAVERCELLVPASQTPIRYWVMAHAPDGVPQTVRIERFEVPLIATDGTLVATGPATAARRAAWPMRLSWRDPTWLDGESRAGYVAIAPSRDVAPEWVPVRLDRDGGRAAPVALAPEVRTTLRVAAGERLDRVFVDVPAGQRRLTLRVDAESDIAVSLVRGPGAGPGASAPLIGAAGESGIAIDLASGVSRDFIIEMPEAGRWFLVVRNTGLRAATLRVTPRLDGTAPVVRPGSYFNPSRSGHGLFVYPAGGDWAGLWLTYGEDGRPTWYYLQGAAPGSNGLWRASLYRSRWNGTSNTLTEVGRAQLAPTGNDAFVFTHTFDGETASEPFVSLGRGCPSLGGAPVDASGLWFNPARAGSGYAVQLFPNYEFHVVFGYDEAGVPRFAVAERTGFGGTDATLDLVQLDGFCPRCAKTAETSRTLIGTLRRTVTGGTLSRISVNAGWVSGLPGEWRVDDPVQRLGASQGCATP